MPILTEILLGRCPRAICYQAAERTTLTKRLIALRASYMNCLPFSHQSCFWCFLRQGFEAKWPNTPLGLAPPSTIGIRLLCSVQPYGVMLAWPGRPRGKFYSTPSECHCQIQHSGNRPRGQIYKKRTHSVRAQSLRWSYCCTCWSKGRSTRIQWTSGLRSARHCWMQWWVQKPVMKRYTLPLYSVLLDERGGWFWGSRTCDTLRWQTTSTSLNTKSICILAPPYQYLLGRLLTILSVLDLTRQPNSEDFGGNTRRLSQFLYYVFMNGYMSGLEACWKCDSSKGTAEGRLQSYGKERPRTSNVGRLKTRAGQSWGTRNY